MKRLVDDSTVEKLISDLPVMGLDIAILPGASGLDIECGDADDLTP